MSADLVFHYLASPNFIHGAGMTLLLTVASLFFGVLIGLVLALISGKPDTDRAALHARLSLAISRDACAVPDHLYLQRAALIRNQAVGVRLRRAGAVPERRRLYGGNPAFGFAGREEGPAHRRPRTRHDHRPDDAPRRHSPGGADRAAADRQPDDRHAEAQRARLGDRGRRTASRRQSGSERRLSLFRGVNRGRHLLPRDDDGLYGRSGPDRDRA